MIRFLFLVLFMCSFVISAQKKVDISIEGFVNDFSSKEKLFGASLYLFQDGRMVSKSLSDVNGNYFISGNITTKIPFDLMISKPGFITKKVLLDFKELKIQNPNGNLQAMEELVIELFEIKDGVDLSFVKNNYAEKFHWDPKLPGAVPDEKFKKGIEDSVIQAYNKVSELNKSESFKKKVNLALNENKYQEAMVYVDSALFYNNNNPDLLNTKAKIEASIEKQAEDIKKRKEFENLKKQGDLAYASKDYETAENFYRDALKIMSDTQIKFKITKIEDYKNKISKLASNKAKLKSLRSTSDSLLALEEYDAAASKLREIQYLDPSQRITIQSEIKSIEKQKKNSNYEDRIEKYIAVAQRLEKSKDSLDASLQFYERAEKIINNLSEQNLIDKYKEQVREGIKGISEKKLEEREAFIQQIEKANANFLKGPDYYQKALKILDSDLMKPYKDDREVLKLKKRITSMDEFYQLKKDAFSRYKNNKKEAVLYLKKALKIGNENYTVTPRVELIEMKDSLKNWNRDLNNSSISDNSSTKDTNSSGFVVRSPGALHSGSDIDAYNELLLTIQQSNNEKSKKNNSINKLIDYEIYFNNVINRSQKEELSRQISTFEQKNQISFEEREIARIRSQNNLKEETKRVDFNKENRKKNIEFQRESSVADINKWSIESDYLLSLSLVEKEKNNQDLNKDLSKHQNQQNEHIENNNKKKVLEQNEFQKEISNQLYQMSVRDSSFIFEKNTQAIEIEKFKSFKSENQKEPNFLKNEDGVLFPSNEVTERIFKNTNSKGFVTSVIIQRIVVDPNGYGVVYEKITSENGSSHYLKNGSSITEHIWFNESMGQNVIEK